MSLKYFVCVALLALVNSSLGEEPELPILTNCGDTLTGNGVIRYKLNEAYPKDEYCTFIVRTDHRGFTFTLRSHGIDENNKDSDAINIFTYGEQGQIDSIHMGPPNPSTTAYAAGGLALIVFRVDRFANGGTGFELEFKGTGPYYKHYSRGGVQMVINSSGGNMTVPTPSMPVPVMGYPTTNIFVFQSPKYSSVRVRFYDEYLNRRGSCGPSSVLVYSFSEGSTKSQGIFCSELHHKTVYDSDGGLLIVVFRQWWDNWDTDRFSIAWRS